MSVLYVNENGAKIGIRENRVVINYQDGMERSVPVETLESIMILGKVQLTTQCMEECLKKGIPVAFLSKGGRYFGRLMSPGHIKPVLQREQALLYDTPFAVELSRRILVAKINNQRVVLKSYARSSKIDVREIDEEMKYCLSHIMRCGTIPELMGYEGHAAKQYFKGLAYCIHKDFHFTGRNRRPPTDPFNSVISLGYSILMNIIYAEIETRGLNPYFGFMHRDAEKHPTLASDLIEEWRAPIVDALAMSLFNGREILKEHFYYDTENPGCFVTKDGLKIILNKLEKKLKTDSKYLAYLDYAVNFRRAIGMQAGRLASAIEEGDPEIYQPVRTR